ncbi:hypothetical protein AB1Y20_023084 [Prymnesium parvum]|uniref:EngB-type G domain-containing protein n=1 Tax=Prymnesium parvum TaxID=97485 RepID=A0AB34JC40_PRYPA
MFPLDVAMALRRARPQPWLMRQSAWRRCSTTSFTGDDSTRDASVRQRLRMQAIDPHVLEWIRGLGVAMRDRRRWGRRGEARVESSSQEATSSIRRMGFVAAATSVSSLPPAALREIAIAGRSNVGKSSLLNALIGKSSGSAAMLGVAKVKNLPGVTRSVDFYSERGRDGPTLVDLPGYGYAVARPDVVEEWQETMRGYISQRAMEGSNLRVLLVIDARQSLRSLDRDFALFLDREARVPLTIIMSKCDLIYDEELAKRYSLLEQDIAELGLRRLVRGDIFPVSSRTGAGIVELRNYLLEQSSPNKGTVNLRESSAPASEPQTFKASPTKRAQTAPSRKHRQIALARLQGQDKRSEVQRKLDKLLGRRGPLEDPTRIAADMWVRRRKRSGVRKR